MLTFGVTFPLFIKYRFEWNANGKLVVELREWSSSTAWQTYYQVILTSTTLDLPLFSCELVGYRNIDFDCSFFQIAYFGDSRNNYTDATGTGPQWSDHCEAKLRQSQEE